MTDEDFLLNEEGILERIDEYTLYTFYLGFAPELDMSYRSPLRNDDLNPSWDLYVSKYAKRREFMWKDKGAGGSHGDIFRLVMLLFGYQTRYQVLARVKGDFGLGPAIASCERIVTHTDYRPRPRAGVDIRVKSKDFNRLDMAFWKRGNVTREILDDYKTTAFKFYWKYVDQKDPSVAGGMAFAYRIMGKYQLYFPHAEKGNKFRTDLTDRELGGFMQLRYNNPLLVITKSMKDVQCMRSFEYDSVTPRGESTVIPAEFMDYLWTKYDFIVTLFDNDGKHNASAYNVPEMHIPLSTGTKDPYDHCKTHGPSDTAALFKQLFSPWLPSA